MTWILTQIFFFLFCIQISLSANCTCNSGKLTCQNICSGRPNSAITGSCTERQLTATSYQCTIKLSGSCPSYYAPTAYYGPKPSFSYATVLSTNCYENLDLDYSYNPLGYVDAYKPKVSEELIYTWAIINFIFLFGCPCIGLCLSLTTDSPAFGAFGVCCALCIVIVEIVLYPFHMVYCKQNFPVPANYNFDVYYGPNLSVSDNWTTTNPNYKFCNLSTTLSYTGLTYQTCSCTPYNTDLKPVQTIWYAYQTRYANCETYHENSGCDMPKGKFWFLWISFGFAGLIGVILICGLCVACLQWGSRGGGGYSSGGGGDYLLIKL